MSGEGACLCIACFVGIALLIWISDIISLAEKSYTPNCYVQDLYIPALNTYSSATFIFFDLNLQNEIDREGVRFRYFNSTIVIYYAQKTIATYTLPAFSQGTDETTHLHDVVETLGMPWSEASAAGSTAAFTVLFSTTVNVRRDIGQSVKKVLLLRAEVEVNSSGESLRKKPIRLLALT